jgi:hypothetical protein
LGEAHQPACPFGGQVLRGIQARAVELRDWPVKGQQLVRLANGEVIEGPWIFAGNLQARRETDSSELS